MGIDRAALKNLGLTLRAYTLRHAKIVRLLALVSTVMVLGSLWGIYHSSNSRPRFGSHSPPPPLHHRPPPLPFNDEFHGQQPQHVVPPGAEDIVLVIKTGAQVLWQRLPVHLITTTRNTPNFLVFSDLPERVGDVVVHDCLRDVDPKYTEGHKDFQIYRDMRDIKPYAVNATYPLAPGHKPWNLPIPELGLNGGWDLDKYKNIPILYQTYRAFPDKKWYIFMDADSYVFIGNVIRYLKGSRRNYDPNKKFYIGSETHLGTEHGPTVVVEWGHGGSGYIISNGAAKDAVEKHPANEHAFEEYTTTDCCGDRALAYMLKKMGIIISPERGPIQGEAWWGIRFGEYNWCQPILSFHHLTPSEIQDLWEFELAMERQINARRKRSNAGETSSGTYITHSDVYHHFVRPLLTNLEYSWDNFAFDDWIETPEWPAGFYHEPTLDDVKSIEDKDLRQKWDSLLRRSRTELDARGHRDKCAQACLERQKCLQWKWAKGRCALHYSFAFGKRMSNPRPEDAFWSGWMLNRIEELRTRMPCEAGRDGNFPSEELLTKPSSSSSSPSSISPAKAHKTKN